MHLGDHLKLFLLVTNSWVIFKNYYRRLYSWKCTAVAPWSVWGLYWSSKGVWWVSTGSCGHCWWVKRESRVTPKFGMAKHLWILSVGGGEGGASWCVHSMIPSLCQGESADSQLRVNSGCLCSLTHPGTNPLCSLCPQPSVRSLPSVQGALSLLQSDWVGAQKASCSPHPSQLHGLCPELPQS